MNRFTTLTRGAGCALGVARARTRAPAITKSLGQSVMLENKTDAGGTLAVVHVARAQSDGYTLLIHRNSMATAPALCDKLAYNPLTDFAYVSRLTQQTSHCAPVIKAAGQFAE